MTTSPITLELDVLRTFVTGTDLGTFARAARHVGRSASAVSAQLKKLEDQLGVPVLRKVGRGMALTPAGEILLGYARRLLALNEEAATAVRATELEGEVRIGLQEDFGERLLPDILGNFARARPQLRVEARVARNTDLLSLVAAGQLDLVLAWDAGPDAQTPGREDLGRLPLCWIGPPHDETWPATASRPLPLVMFAAPCTMRSAAITALDRGGRTWRSAFASSSLSAIWAAVAAGLGVTVRTRAGMPSHLRVLRGMPRLPSIGVVLYYARANPEPAVRELGAIVATHARALVRAARLPG